MKRIYLLLFLLLFIFPGCKNISSPVSKVENKKENIKEEVKENMDDKISSHIEQGEIDAAQSIAKAFRDKVWLVTFPSNKTSFVKVFGSQNDNIITFSFIDLLQNVSVRVSEFSVIKSVEYSSELNREELRDIFTAGSVFNTANKDKTLRNEENDKMISFSSFNSEEIDFILSTYWGSVDDSIDVKFLYDETENLLFSDFVDKSKLTEEQLLFFEDSYYVENIKNGSEVYLVSKDFSTFYMLSNQNDMLMILRNDKGNLRVLMNLQRKYKIN